MTPSKTKLLDIEQWPRKELFHFFKTFEEPFFGITVEVDCGQAFQRCKEQGISFFLHYLHCSLVAANSVDNFAYRLVDDQVVVHDRVDGSATINRPNGSFGFSYIAYSEDWETFKAIAEAEIARVRASTGLLPAQSGENVIHYSSIPWIKFTSLSHARALSKPDSCPKISFGKMTTHNGRSTMPMSIHAHHALMDGFHVSQYIDKFQELLLAE